jgi:hypothetical protein
MTIKLSKHDRADICVFAAFFGLLCIVVAVATGVWAFTPVPPSLPLSMATIGVISLLAGVLRLRQAATGTSPFKDDTFTRLLDNKAADKAADKDG